MSYEQLAYLHLATVVPAFAIGTWLLVRRKGSPSHRALGRVYLVLIGGDGASVARYACPRGAAVAGALGPDPFVQRAHALHCAARLPRGAPGADSRAPQPHGGPVCGWAFGGRGLCVFSGALAAWLVVGVGAWPMVLALVFPRAGKAQKPGLICFKKRSSLRLLHKR